MTIELKVTYEGTEPGLADHRLSLSSFADPLRLLVAALQRTASAMLAQAIGDPEYGSKGGKLAADAKLLDLELATVEPGSAVTSFVCVTRAKRQTTLQMPGFDLADASIERLLLDIDSERSKQPRNASVRKYLSALPNGVTKQRYTGYRNGTAFLDVKFDTAMLADMPSHLPRLIQIGGVITSVGFEPGVTFVTIKSGDRSLKCAATTQQVDAAVQLRSQTVSAAVLVDEDKAMLLRLSLVTEERNLPPLESTISHLHSGWKNTLQELAR